MLNNIRKASDSFIIRILLAMIAFAFVGWGIKDVLQAKGNIDLVTFSKAKNISEADFLKAKSEEISNIQRQTGTNLSEEEISQLDIDNIVMRKLVDDSMMQYMVGYYDLDLSDQTIIQFVKDSPIFKNSNGEFDIELFKSTFKNSYRSEEDYLLNIKKEILRDTLVTTLLESFQAPNIMIKNFIDYMSEVRYLDLVSINLKHHPKDLIIAPPTTETLEQFYQNNQDLFKIPETRNFSFIKISNKFLQNKINITDDELVNYYNENKDEFNNKPFVQVKKTVLESLNKQKYEEANIEFNKNLEDAVAAGATLSEIAEKFGLQLEELLNVTYDDITTNKTGISLAADSIFELTEGEVSYPLELEDKAGLLLVELKSIEPSRIEDFINSKDKVMELWQGQYLENLNFKIFENIAKEYTPNNFNAKYLATKAITVNSRFSISRSEFGANDKLPEELLTSVFQMKKNSNSPIVTSGDKAYFVHLKSTKIDPNIARNIKKKAEDNISKHIKYGIIEEIITYLSKENNMQVKHLIKSEE